MTISDFLLARIAEDEAMTEDWLKHGDSWLWFDHHRVLAECEAKRRIVEWCVDEAGNPWEVGPVLSFLALPHADHPDYDEGWRP